MNLVVARSYKYLLSAATVVVFLGCDQVNDITSGGGTKDTEPTQTSTGTISGQSSDASLSRILLTKLIVVEVVEK